jgi:1-acyl-sn-glycerol-3-phosphate acyltransferase
MQPFKTSYIIMAAQSGAPIIPCYHKGNYGLFKRTKVAIGKPIYTKDFFEGTNPTLEQINKMNEDVFKKML